MQSQDDVVNNLHIHNVTGAIHIPGVTYYPYENPLTKWFDYKSLIYINNDLFSKGLVAFTDHENDNWRSTIDRNNIHFCGPQNKSQDAEKDKDTAAQIEATSSDPDVAKPLNSRVLSFLPAGTIASQTSDAANNNQSSLSKAWRQELKTMQNLLSKLAAFANSKQKDSMKICENDQSQFLIYNPLRRKEIFLPTHLGDTALYFCPWLSKQNAKWQFTGFNHFVTASCLFGTSLKARNNKKRKFPMIKHFMDFYDGEQIVNIAYNNSLPNAYELSFLIELQKMFALIKKLSVTTHNPELTIHIPGYDYILFGIELYLQGRITKTALENFITIIFDKITVYKKHIRAACDEHNIKVAFISPFDNLFGDIDNTQAMLVEINKLLGLADATTFSYNKENEEKFVWKCLFKLVNNNYYDVHQFVWKDFLNSSVHENNLIKTMEDLFKIANAVIIGITAWKTEPYSTCSLLPLDEKEIQRRYSDYSNKIAKDIYPPVFMGTILPTLLSYSEDTNGQLFYFDLDGGDASICELIKENIIESASSNIIRLMNDASPKQITDFIVMQSSPRSPSPEPVNSSPDDTPPMSALSTSAVIIQNLKSKELAYSSCQSPDQSQRTSIQKNTTTPLSTSPPTDQSLITNMHRFSLSGNKTTITKQQNTQNAESPIVRTNTP